MRLDGLKSFPGTDHSRLPGVFPGLELKGICIFDGATGAIFRNVGCIESITRNSTGSYTLRRQYAAGSRFWPVCAMARTDGTDHPFCTFSQTDATELERIIRTWGVNAGPGLVAIDPAEVHVFVWDDIV